MTLLTEIDRLKREVGELIERHEQAKDLSDFAVYADDPVGFIRDVLGGTPWDRQEEIGLEVRDHPLVSVRSANGIGKDWLAARLALWWVFARGGYVLCTAPTERQVKNVVMGEIRQAFNRAKVLPGELFEMALRVDREGKVGLLAFTSSEASRLTGFHAPRLMVLATEAQGIEDFAWEAAHACLTGQESRFLAEGNPLNPTGKFYQTSRSDLWRSLRISAFEHPNVKEGREVIPGAVTREFVERIEKEYGKGSGIYQSRVLGEFPEDADEGVFSRAWLDAAALRHETGELRLASMDAPPIVSVDPARFGPDKTVVAIRRGQILHEFVSWSRKGTSETVGRLRELLPKAGITPKQEVPVLGSAWWAPARRTWRTETRGGEGTVIVDTVGVGGGVFDQLKEIGYPTTSFNGGESPRSTRGNYLNRRAESYWELRRLLEGGTIAIPRDEELFEELLALRWKPTSSGLIQLESKDDLRGRLGRSPDKADALAMAFWAQVRKPADHRPLRRTWA